MTKIAHDTLLPNLLAGSWSIVTLLKAHSTAVVSDIFRWRSSSPLLSDHTLCGFASRASVSGRIILTVMLQKWQDPTHTHIHTGAQGSIDHSNPNDVTHIKRNMKEPFSSFEWAIKAEIRWPLITQAWRDVIWSVCVCAWGSTSDTRPLGLSTTHSLFVAGFSPCTHTHTRTNNLKNIFFAACKCKCLQKKENKDRQMSSLCPLLLCK